MTVMHEIGGYFGLELPPKGNIPYANALRFQSARAAFHSLLKAGVPRKVWMPRYICDSMIAPLLAANVPIGFYKIDENLEVDSSVRLGDGEWLLYVNYFGICAAEEQAILGRFNPDQVVLDQSQAFFSPPGDCLANIYSPRKFFGIPDGGLLLSRIPIDPPAEDDAASLARTEHLLMRHAGLTEAGYRAFKRAEQSLDDIAPRHMSRLTSRILEAVDFEGARARRTANFRFLHQRLGRMNELALHSQDPSGPLCYPLLSNVRGLRELLLESNVYVPTYWPEVINRVVPGDLEMDLLTRCLPLPCDQRYSESDLEVVVDLVLSSLPTKGVKNAT